MKTTFLIGLPRCGSFALSLLMNNQKCLAHHEGFDFDLIMKKQMPYPKTDSFKLRESAHKSRRHYFNCDASLSTEHIRGLIKDDSVDSGEYQVVMVSSDANRSRDYLYEELVKNGNQKGTGLMNKIMQLLTNQIELNMMILLYYKTKNFPLLIIEKDGNPDPRHFTPSQLTDIAKFVGAYPDTPEERKALAYAARGNISISSEMMQQSLTEIHQHQHAKSVRFN
jgi:hypothetical protein